MSQENRFRLRDSAPSGGNRAARRRLAESFVRLQNIDLARMENDDPQYAKPLEHRIVWRELIELELQDIDERIAKIAGLQ